MTSVHVILVCLFTSANAAYILEKVAKAHEIHSCTLRELEGYGSVTCTGTHTRGKDTGTVSDNSICTIIPPENSDDIVKYRKCVRGKWINLRRKVHPTSKRVKRWFRVRRTLRRVWRGIRRIVCRIFCEGDDGDHGGNHPPKITCPVIASTFTAGPSQATVRVTWPSATASDPDGDTPKVTQTGGQASGSQFSRGSYTISYQAEDNHGAKDVCQFHFEVNVITCNPPEWPLYGSRSCNNINFVYGTRCTYSCIDGFDLSGSQTLTCQQSGIYDKTPPTCVRKQCSSMQQIQNGNIVCMNGNYVDSVCIASCNDGYGLSGIPISRCQTNSIWTTWDPVCEDTEEPEFTYCPSNTYAYTGRGESFAIADWRQPEAADNQDNGNVSISLLEGQPSGSIFPVGVHVQQYVAIDASGNKSPFCQFSVIVQELSCDSPEGLFRDAFIFTRCYSGFSFGSACDVLCSNNYQLIGNASSISCERNGTVMTWQWSGKQEPACNSDICADLVPPVNGALACWQAGVNEYCTMSCNKDKDIPRTVDVKSFYFCSDNGEWVPSAIVPNCTEKRRPGSNILPSTLYYFTGDCSDPVVQNGIKTNFTIIMRNQQGLNVCQPPDCSLTDVSVKCGPTNKKRNTPLLELHFFIKLKWQIQNGSSLEEFNYNENIIMDIWEKIKEKGPEIAVNVNGTTFDHATYDWTLAKCEYGFKVRYHSTGVSCAGCPTGTMYNGTLNDCESCPIGKYQDQDFQTSCKDCPVGTSTEKVGSTSQHHCIDICKAGHFSSSGVKPCESCPKGTYQSKTMSTSCDQCDVTKTTIGKGSTSSSSCLEFDIVFNVPGSNFNFQPTETDIQDFTLSFWSNCPNATRSPPAFKITENGEVKLNITCSSIPAIYLLGQHLEVSQDFPKPWNHIVLRWNAATKTAMVFMNEIHNNFILDVMETRVAVAGSKPHIDQIAEVSSECKITGFFFTTYALSDAEISNIANTCYPKVDGATYTMGDFKTGVSVGFDFITPSMCDALDECKSSPCGEHKCKDLLNGYKCTCIKGYTGDRCEIAPNYCLNNECLNGATCKTNTWNYTCECPDGFLGIVCEERIVDGSWSGWTDWGGCNVTCGSGIQFRQRTCTNPPPDPDGKRCVGIQQEQRSCNTDKCPKCLPSSSIRNALNVLTCSTTGDFTTCEVACRPGYVWANEPQNPYYCGANSSYVWVPERQTPACTLVQSPYKMSTQMKIAMDGLPCSDDAKQSLQSNINTLACVKNSTCLSEVSLTGCDESSRKRRSTSPTTVEVILFVNLEGGDNLDLAGYLNNGTESEGLKNYLDALISLETTAQELNASVENIFNVTINGVTYEVDTTSFNITGNVSCPEGSIPEDGSCVNCPPGTKLVNSWCTWCDIGTYQEEFAQTQCIDCPDGYTTKYLGSTNITQCSVVENVTSTPQNIEITDSTTTTITTTTENTESTTAAMQDVESTDTTTTTAIIIENIESTGTTTTTQDIKYTDMSTEPVIPKLDALHDRTNAKENDVIVIVAVVLATTLLIGMVTSGVCYIAKIKNMQTSNLTSFKDNPRPGSSVSTSMVRPEIYEKHGHWTGLNGKTTSLTAGLADVA